jgi:hypothetical protein
VKDSSEDSSTSTDSSEEELRAAAEAAGIDVDGDPEEIERALREKFGATEEPEATSSRTIEALGVDDTTGVTQQVAAGSRASFDVADRFNPGFTDLEVVNRLGFVASLTFEYDYQQNEWVPAAVDRTERQAVEQQLATDDAREDLGNVVDTDDSTTVDSNGDLKLDPGTETENDIKDTPDATGDTKGQPLFEWDNGPASGEVTGTFDDSAPANPKCELQNLPQNTSTDFISMDTPEFAVPFSGNAGDNWSIRVYRSDENYWQPNEYWGISTPLSTEFGDAWGQAATGETSGDFYAVDKVGSPDPAEEGTATSSFDNPCRTSGQRSAQYNTCSSELDVTVDLYVGDPLQDGNEPIRRDIDPREDITDLPPGVGDLQYAVTLKRADDGSSPKIERLGHQYIK